MKRVLITGANSYIGMSFEAYVKEYYSDRFEIDTVDMQAANWREHDFSKYDIVFHVAGLAHCKETKKNRDLYFSINRDLAIETAKKAKMAGVEHFIFLSTMSVYGMLIGEISRDTIPNPNSAYGKSKLEAEVSLFELADENFTVSVLRPPMIYGNNCKGNYQLLRRFALTIGVFPQYENKRSMLFVDNLSSSVIGIIDRNETDIYFPQNLKYMSSADMVEAIGVYNGKKVYMIKLFNPLIDVLVKRVSLFKKVFGTLIYEESTNVPQDWIHNEDNKNCIRCTELKEHIPTVDYEENI